jgi:hypothetical protein
MNSATLMGLLVCAITLIGCGGGADAKLATGSNMQANSPAMARALGASVVEVPSSVLVDQAVNLQDAIAILKLIVGLDVNSTGQAVTPYQVYAADFDGNGKVELTDAIGVLKHVVGLDSPIPKWVFFNQSGGAPVVSDKLNPAQPPELGAGIGVSSAVNVSLVAALRGDVVGSTLSYAWTMGAKPAGSKAVLTDAAPVFTVDLVGHYVVTLTATDGSSIANAMVTLTAAVKAVAPAAPTALVATAGDASVSIAFTPGAAGSASLSYTASCTAAGVTKTGTGAASPIVVTGLSNGTAYACTVTAANSAGSSAPSAAVSVTPVAKLAVPGKPTVSSVSAGNAQVSVAFTAPSTGGTGISSYTVTCTGSLSASGSSSPIIVTGLSNGSSYSCTVTATNNAGSGEASTVSASFTPTAGVAQTVYHAPAPFASVLKSNYQAANLVSVSAMLHRGRYLISDSASATASANYLTIGTSYSASTGFALESGAIATGSTYNTYLSKLVQVMADASGYFRLDSHLHPNNSIDADAADGNRLKFRNNFGKAAQTYGYVVFSYDGATKLLQARKRYKYSYDAVSFAASYTEDSSFAAANYYVNAAAGSYSLVAGAASASKFYLYNSPIDFSVPVDMNPLLTAPVSNAAAAFKSKTTTAATEGANGSIYRSVNSTYRGQVLTAGSDATTKTNADAMLAKIKTAVESKGEKLRYDTAVYTVFRDAALATTLVSDAIADGAPGQNLVPYVYFTNEQDASGNYHPFMIVVNYGNAASPHGLLDIPRPPGDGQGGGYQVQKVTRYSNLENYITRIPMKDYGVVTSVTENKLTATLLSDVGGNILSANVYSYASIADNGLLIDGSVMFPVFNNTLIPSQAVGELTASGCHVGQGGGGPHCHADGSQSGNGVRLYNDSDYVGKSHPPLIGFGYDGVALFGVYRAGTDTAMLGSGTALDGFGGHAHDGIGYHYHAHLVPNYPLAGSATGYTLHVLMKGAYIGKINSVPYFNVRTGFNNNKYMGGTVPP